MALLSPKNFLPFLLISIHYLSQTDGKVIEGHLNTSENFHYLDKFNSFYNGGEMAYEIEYESEIDYVSIVLYHHRFYWESRFNFRDESKNCHEKVYEKTDSILLSPESQIVTTRDTYNGGYVKTERVPAVCEVLEAFDRDEMPTTAIPSTTTSAPTNGTTAQSSYYSWETSTTTPAPKKVVRGKLKCVSSKSFDREEGWWFIALSSCESSQGMNLKYKLTLTNDKALNENNGYYWLRQFSADEYYVLPALLGYGGGYLCFIFAIIAAAGKLKRDTDFSFSNKLYLTSVLVQIIGLTFLCVSYSIYASNGIGLPNLKLAGKLTEAFGEWIAIFMLLHFVASGRDEGIGWTLGLILSLYSSLYITVYLAVFAIEKYAMDASMLLFMYMSPVGYVLIGLRTIGAIMFIVLASKAVLQNEGKGLFYLLFGLGFSTWFVFGPIIAIMMNTYRWEDNRENYFAIIHHAWIISGHAGYLLLFILRHALPLPGFEKYGEPNCNAKVKARIIDFWEKMKSFWDYMNEREMEWERFPRATRGQKMDNCSLVKNEEEIAKSEKVKETETGSVQNIA